jgi:hypothetical protein
MGGGGARKEKGEGDKTRQWVLTTTSRKLSLKPPNRTGWNNSLGLNVNLEVFLIKSQIQQITIP